MGLLLLVLAGAAVPLLLTLELKHNGERGIEAERDLARVGIELQVQDGLEWRAISGREELAPLAEGLSASRARVDVLLAQATDRGLPAADAARLAELLQIYSHAVDEELRLLATGQLDEALEHDEAQVDPTFERTEDLLGELAEQVAARGRRAGWLSDAGLAATVLLSLGTTAVAQGRRRRSQVRREAEQRGEARYRALVDQSDDIVLVVDRDGVVGWTSPAAERLLAGGPVDPAAEALLSAHVTEADRPVLQAALETASVDRPAGLVLRIGQRTFQVTVQDLGGHEAVGGLVVTGHDVTAQIALRDEMEHRALHDALTGLPNRALLADRFELALHANRRNRTVTGLLLIDLDRFKEINDTFGHHYGDALLVQVGRRLAPVIRAGDTVARLGGDEFAVLLPDVGDLDGLRAVAEQLRAALRAPFLVEGVELDVQASVGMVVSAEHGDDAATLLQRADVAMYVAKRQHSGLAAYDPTSDQHTPQRLSVLGDLRRALTADQIVLHYQPQVCLATGAVVGAEALVRWQHPELGLVLPDQFIPMAERTGLIVPLTDLVLDLAVRQARAWADAGQAIPVSVNLSARNLLDEQLPPRVVDVLVEHGLPAHLLRLELTESAIMVDPARAHRQLDVLAATGVRLSVDDFGADYTSLAQLKELPVTELKIDKSLVQRMAEDPRDAAIVESLVDLGHKLGLALVAEGVETAECLSALAAYGCDTAQGYLLLRAEPAAAFVRWRTEHEASLLLRRAEVAGGARTADPRLTC